MIRDAGEPGAARPAVHRRERRARSAARRAPSGARSVSARPPGAVRGSRGVLSNRPFLVPGSDGPGVLETRFERWQFRPVRHFAPLESVRDDDGASRERAYLDIEPQGPPGWFVSAGSNAVGSVRQMREPFAIGIPAHAALDDGVSQHRRLSSVTSANRRVVIVVIKRQPRCLDDPLSFVTERAARCRAT